MKGDIEGQFDEQATENYHELAAGAAEVRVFLGNSGIPGWTRPGDVQIHLDGEWDERDNWTPRELRDYAAALNRAADISEALRDGRTAPEAVPHA